MGVVAGGAGAPDGAISGAASGGAAAKSSKGPDPALVAKLENSARGSVTIRTKKSTNAASFVKAGQNGDLLPSRRKGPSAQAKAHDFLTQYGALLGVDERGSAADPDVARRRTPRAASTSRTGRCRTACRCSAPC